MLTFKSNSSQLSTSFVQTVVILVENTPCLDIIAQVINSMNPSSSNAPCFSSLAIQREGDYDLLLLPLDYIEESSKI